MTITRSFTTIEALVYFMTPLKLSYGTALYEEGMEVEGRNGSVERRDTAIVIICFINKQKAVEMSELNWIAGLCI